LPIARCIEVFTNVTRSHAKADTVKVEQLGAATGNEPEKEPEKETENEHKRGERRKSVGKAKAHA
jgi:hypothetical protein